MARAWLRARQIDSGRPCSTSSRASRRNRALGLMRTSEKA